MKNILILGAGLSSYTLVNYLIKNSEKYSWKIRVGDVSVEEARKKTGDHPNAKAVFINVEDQDHLITEIRKADIVVSMLPPRFHAGIAGECIRFGVNMVTASYVSGQLKQMDERAREKNILILNEMGVDPGIDHMSAMRIIDRLRESGDKLIAFESATGGLVAPEYDNNPWNYKFTWAPRNVVLAGSGGARFLHNDKFKYIPYHKIFSRYEIIEIPGLGQFEVYPNRDSLQYQETYGLEDLSTMFRGTIRRPGFCDAWDLLVQLGATDDTYTMDDTEHMTFREFTNSFIGYNIIDPVEKKVADYLGIGMESECMEKLKWLGLFEDTVVGIPGLTPAKVLQLILHRKWQMDPEDKDMIVMQHQFDYMRLGHHRKLYSTMVLRGEDTVNTAMSKSVGLPVAIATKLILEGKIQMKGVRIPVEKEIYEPVLNELEEFGIVFKEEEVVIS
jgi:saccharopine dehydrogenase-like NADP-dependent oxidoreductase